jgi:hypothetical protein
LKYGDEAEREKFIKENFNFPLQYVDTTEELETLMSSVSDLLYKWQRRGYYGDK